MPVYQITYNTENKYSPTVSEVVLEFLVLPATTQTQQLVEYHIENQPESKYHIGSNLFDFDFIRYRLKNQVSEFKFRLTATVKNEFINPYEFTSVDYEDEKSILNSNVFAIDHFPFLNISELTTLPENFRYPTIDNNEQVFDFIKRINHFVKLQLHYEKKITDPLRKLNQTVAERCGVCQDFAHFMSAILRANNIPARYVSGYLNQGENRVGTGAVHAWVQAMIPGVGWMGFDPTNELMEDHNYIKIAHGVDISDCTTLKGVIKGPGSNQTDYQVLIEEQIKGNNQ
jgi:transglutaminase-like putative cysteine protease